MRALSTLSRAENAPWTFSMRWAWVRPVCEGVSLTRASQSAFTGRGNQRASSLAMSSAWLKPRARWRRECSGTGTIASTSPSAGFCATTTASQSPRGRASERTALDFKSTIICRRALAKARNLRKQSTAVSPGRHGPQRAASLALSVVEGPGACEASESGRWHCSQKARSSSGRTRPRQPGQMGTREAVVSSASQRRQRAAKTTLAKPSQAERRAGVREKNEGRAAGPGAGRGGPGWVSVGREGEPPEKLQQSPLLFLLAADAVAGPGNGFEALLLDFFLAGGAEAEAAVLHPPQGLLHQCEDVALVVRLAEEELLGVGVGGLVGDVLGGVVSGPAFFLGDGHQALELLALGVQLFLVVLQAFLIHARASRLPLRLWSKLNILAAPSGTVKPGGPPVVGQFGFCSGGL